MNGVETLETSPPKSFHSRWVLERRWVDPRHLPHRRLLAKNSTRSNPQPFHFTDILRRICADVVYRCPEFRPINTEQILVTYTPCRNRSRFGLQARVTPMRFRDGALTQRRRGILYGIQRYYVAQREMLYLLSFSLPRFLDQSFEEKLVTIFHELYHISPTFNGDLRRLPGRYEVHSHSKAEYDRYMSELVRPYLMNHPQPEIYEPLRFRTKDILNRHGAITGIVVPRPKLIPLIWSVG
jgi:hypothetical protein